MILGRLSRTVSVLLLLQGGCGDTQGPRFSDDSGAPADMPTGGMCTSAAQCNDNLACTRDACLVGGVCEHVPDGPSCVVPTRCTGDAMCNDNIACTRDRCLVDGTCGHTPQNDMCPSGTCNPTTGCGGMTTPGTCRTDADCRDAYDCTVDSCGTDGRCVITPQNGRCTTMGQVCRVGMGCIRETSCARDADCDDRMRCNGTERCVEFGCVAGTRVACDDMNECTIDTCNETGTMCTNMMNPTCMGGAAPRSGIYAITPRLMYMCVDKIFGMPVVNLNLTAIQITVSSSAITVTGAPATMTGSAVSAGMFSASGTVAGDCNEIYTLRGMFSDDRRFTGTFTIEFRGFGCALATCRNQTFSVTGTLGS